MLPVRLILAVPPQGHVPSIDDRRQERQQCEKLHLDPIYPMVGVASVSVDW